MPSSNGTDKVLVVRVPECSRGRVVTRSGTFDSIRAVPPVSKSTRDCSGSGGSIAGFADMDLVISDDLTIPESELEFQTSTSGGPGGQHVNKTETKVTVLLDLAQSSALSERQKELVRERLANRINRDDVLQVSSQEHRSQSANRDAALSRLIQLIAEALKEEKPRKKTKKPRRAHRERLEEKKQQAEKKRLRENPDPANY